MNDWTSTINLANFQNSLQNMGKSQYSSDLRKMMNIDNCYFLPDHIIWLF